MERDHVEHLYNLLTQYNANISIVRCYPFYEGALPETDRPTKEETMCLDCNEALKYVYYQKGIDVSAWAKLYSKELFDSIRYPKGWLFEDLPTTYRLMTNAKRVAFSTRRTYYYLIRENSIDGKMFNENKYHSAVKILNQLQEDRAGFPKDVQSAFNSRIVSFIFHILLQLPADQIEMRRVLFRYLKPLRLSVIFDTNAKPKIRIASFLSYGGMSLINMFKTHGLSRK